jgi:Ni/Co efflux regulator RcnB
MKKFILAALAASTLATPVLAAPGDRHDARDDNRGRVEQRHDVRNDRHDVRQPQRIEYRKWQKGQRFDSRYAQNYRVVTPNRYHLRPAPRGYRWVQSGNDAVMVGITTGIIASVIAGAIN